MFSLEAIKDRVLNNGKISLEEALFLIEIETESEIDKLANIAHQVNIRFNSKKADLCSLISAKSGLCPEDCAFCSQSAHHRCDVTAYPLVDEEKILAAAKDAEKNGAHRFCIVTSGGKLTEEEFERVLGAFRRIKQETKLLLDGSLGFLTGERIESLKHAGVKRINHNLETSERFYPNIVTTHSFKDRVDTIKLLKRHGIEVCAGGIIGLGESRRDRIEMAFLLKDLGAECVPINILNSRPGTPLEKQERLTPSEIIKTISVFRLILPRATIKIAGGREINLGTHQKRALKAGANGIIIGGYLTTSGNSAEKDLALVRDAGFEV